MTTQLFEEGDTAILESRLFGCSVEVKITHVRPDLSLGWVYGYKFHAPRKAHGFAKGTLVTGISPEKNLQRPGAQS